MDSSARMVSSRDSKLATAPEKREPHLVDGLDLSGGVLMIVAWGFDQSRHACCGSCDEPWLISKAKL